MSQAKVDRYKEEKKNRKKIMAKEKRMRIAGYVAGCLVAAGIIGWAGYSGYSAYEALSLIHISEPTRRTPISYAVFCLKKKMACK